MPPKPKKKVVQDTIKPTYRNIGNANFASRQRNATKQDSADYRYGFRVGMNAIPPKNTAERNRMYPNASDYFTQGRYEGQNNPQSFVQKQKRRTQPSDTTFVNRVKAFFDFNK